MPNLHRQLRTSVARMAEHPLPITWTQAEPELAGYPTVAEVLAAASGDGAVHRSDRTIRALIRISHRDPDAALVLLDALLPAISRCIGHVTKAEFRREVLADLAFVILEADDTERVDHLAHRLAKRAYRRTMRRIETETRFRDHRIGLDEALDAPACTVDIDDLIADRVHLAEVGLQVERAITEGRLSAQTWAVFCEGKLVPAVTGERRPVDRRATYGAVRVVRRQLDHAC